MLWSCAEFTNISTCGLTSVSVFVVTRLVTFVAITATSQESLHAVDDIEMISVFVQINFGFFFFSRINDGIKVFSTNNFDLNIQ